MESTICLRARLRARGASRSARSAWLNRYSRSPEAIVSAAVGAAGCVSGAWVAAWVAAALGAWRETLEVRVDSRPDDAKSWYLLGHVDLRLYDIQGRLVRSLVDGVRSSGANQARWDGRDDAGRFMGAYVQQGVYPEDPFHVLDSDGVGELLTIGAERGRRGRSDLTLSVCGEHAGDPDSIAFCRAAGFDYVSCSPFRVPVARLAAAHAALRQRQLATGTKSTLTRGDKGA